jgi:hypothetical protein
VARTRLAIRSISRTARSGSSQDRRSRSPYFESFPAAPARLRHRPSPAPDLLVFVRDEAIFAQRIDLKTFQLTGEAVQIANEVSVNQANGRAAFAVQGDILVYHAQVFPNANLVWYDRQGRRGATAGKQERVNAVRLSPDEKTASVLLGVFGKTDLATVDLTTGALTRLRQTANISNFVGPWSPDSRRLLVNVGGGPPLEATLGTGQLRQLEHKGCVTAVDWSPDGGAILCYGAGGVFAFTADGGGEPRKVAGMIHYPRISPDGKHVAYMAQEAGKFHVEVATFPGFADRRRVSVGETSLHPQWRSDGRELYFASLDSIMSAELRPGDRIDPGPPRVLFKAPMIRTSLPPFAAARDGSRFLIIEPVQSKAVRPIHAVVNRQTALGK